MPAHLSQVVLMGGAHRERVHLAQTLQQVLQSLGHRVAVTSPDAPEAWPSSLAPPSQCLLWQTLGAEHVPWRQALHAWGTPYQVIHGDGPQALKQAVYALLPPEQAHGWARQPVQPRWTGVCEACGDAACEQRLFGRLLENSVQT